MNKYRETVVPTVFEFLGGCPELIPAEGGVQEATHLPPAE